MPSLDQKQELVVWTEHRALDEAKSVFAQFDAAFQTVPCDSPSRLAKSPVFVFYLPNGEQEAAVERALNTFRSCKSSALVFYTPHHTSHFAFRIGTMVGRKKLPEAEWAFNLQHLKQLLRDRNIAAHTRRKHDPTPSLDLPAIRKRLSLSQKQLASALNVTPRTLQNWEAERGTSQVHKKIRDFAELLALMDDYVVAPKEEEWLSSPLPALGGKSPRELIAKGRIRDLVIEFERLREGQPV
jgi:DNA-binding transcriptional regulator YiaG